MDRIAPPLIHFSNFKCSKAQSALGVRVYPDPTRFADHKFNLLSITYNCKGGFAGEVTQYWFGVYAVRLFR